MANAKIIGTGYYLPEQVVTNDQIAECLDTSDEWIQKRVGIRSRHIAGSHETTVMMSQKAAQQALCNAKVSAETIELIIVATSTSDDLMPSTACSLQAALGINTAIAFDLSAACSGFIYALHTANQFFKTGAIKHALVVGVERMSRVLDWQDRSTCVLFGDGAGAVVLSATETEGIIASRMFSSGKQRDLLNIPSQLPKSCTFFDKILTDTSPSHLAMVGNKVFRHAVTMLGEVVDKVLQDSGYCQRDIDWLIPHQANVRIIQATAQQLKLSMHKVIVTLPEHGNTSAASIPMALAVSVEKNLIHPGQLLLLEAFGAGFVWGACLVRF